MIQSAEEEEEAGIWLEHNKNAFGCGNKDKSRCQKQQVTDTAL